MGPFDEDFIEIPPLPYVEAGGMKPCSYSREYELVVQHRGVVVGKIANLQRRTYWLFGRYPNCKVHCKAEWNSRYHAVLQYRAPRDTEPLSDQFVSVAQIAPGWYVFDLNSEHGTFVNNVAVAPRTYVRVFVGSKIRLGPSSVTFTLNGCDDETIVRNMEAHRPWFSSVNGIWYRKNCVEIVSSYFQRVNHEPEVNYGFTLPGTFHCSLPLPIDDALGRPIEAQGTHGSIVRAAGHRCIQEASRLLYEAGVLTVERFGRRKPMCTPIIVEKQAEPPPEDPRFKAAYPRLIRTEGRTLEQIEVITNKLEELEIIGERSARTQITLLRRELDKEMRKLKRLKKAIQTAKPIFFKELEEKQKQKECKKPPAKKRTAVVKKKQKKQNQPKMEAGAKKKGG